VFILYSEGTFEMLPVMTRLVPQDRIDILRPA
jgi:hypothetical protein